MSDVEEEPTEGEMAETARVGYIVCYAALRGTPSIILPKKDGGYTVMLLVDAPPTVHATLAAIVESAPVTIPLDGTEEEMETQIQVVRGSSSHHDNTWTHRKKKET
jgi:hypothetical protein